MAKLHPPAKRNRQRCLLFSIVGLTPHGREMALIVADSEADATLYARHELHFETVSHVAVVSDRVHLLSGTQ
jgi:hypothetical protein